jgi:hypothetical protein
MSYTTLQSPKTLEPGEVLAGAGISSPNASSLGLEVNTRVGIVKNFDVGAKFNIGSLIFLDGKFEIIQNPIYLSADIGWSYFSYSGDYGHDKGKTTCWYPTIIAGQDHWYVAVKRVYMLTESEFDFIGIWKYSGSGWISTNFTAGAILGDKIRFIPEINMIMLDKTDQTIFVPAIGLQFIID